MKYKNRLGSPGMILSLAMMAFFAGQAMWHIWGEKGVARILEIRSEIDNINHESAFLADKNRALEQEILDIKGNLETLEHVAREDLGMIREGETFFYFTEEETSPPFETP